MFEIYSTTYPFVLSAAIALGVQSQCTKIVKELGEVEFSRWQDVKMGLFLSLIIYLGILFLHFCSLHFLFSRVAKCTQEKTIEILSLNYFKLIVASFKKFKANLQN